MFLRRRCVSAPDALDLLFGVGSFCGACLLAACAFSGEGGDELLKQADVSAAEQRVGDACGDVLDDPLAALKDARNHLVADKRPGFLLAKLASDYTTWRMRQMPPPGSPAANEQERKPSEQVWNVEGERTKAFDRCMLSLAEAATGLRWRAPSARTINRFQWFAIHVDPDPLVGGAALLSTGEYIFLDEKDVASLEAVHDPDGFGVRYAREVPLRSKASFDEIVSRWSTTTAGDGSFLALPKNWSQLPARSHFNASQWLAVPEGFAYLQRGKAMKGMSQHPAVVHMSPLAPIPDAPALAPIPDAPAFNGEAVHNVLPARLSYRIGMFHHEQVARDTCGLR